jgi:hypothetical protein
MSREKAKALMKRAGLDDDPLSHCRTLEEFNDELAKLPAKLRTAVTEVVLFDV